MLTDRFHARALVAAALAGALATGAAQAQTKFPTEDVHFIVGFAAGSGPDVITRWVADKMQAKLGQTIVIENKVGAGGNIATEYVARAEPDGHTLYVTGGNALAASGHLYKNPPVDVSTAFKTVATLARQPTLLVVAANSPHKTLGEFAAAIKEKGEKASYGVAFPAARVLGGLFRDGTGGKAVEVQYRTSADWLNDLSSGAVDYAIIDAVTGTGHAKDGRLRILGLSTAEAPESMKDYETLESAGFEIDMAGWWAVFAPAKTPDAIVDQLHDAFTEVVESDDAKAFFSNISNEAWPTTRAEAEAYYQKEYKDWRGYVEAAGIEPAG